MKTDLGGPLLEKMQGATFHYSWRGIPLIKNPFDFALYPLLLWRVQPRTVIELGSYRGGSALWMADLLSTFDIDGHVYSIDRNPPQGIEIEGVTFLQGDAGSPLGLIECDSLPHPWIVIDDASHQYGTCRAVLHQFDPWMLGGDYFVVEDGIVEALGMADRFEGGPNRAVSEFLEEHDGEYTIDRSYCDFFGTNATYATDGYLRCTR